MQLTRRKFMTMALAGGSAAALMPVATALASPPTPITTLPATITSPGSYILTGNHSLSLEYGAAIQVQSRDVTIDLGGFTITNSGVSADTTAVGVLGWNDGLTVRNGTVKGFYAGVYTKNPSNAPLGGHHIMLVEAESCLGAGFMIDGSGCVVRGCTVTTQGRSTVGSTPGCLYSFGIVVNHSANALLIDNTIDANGYSASDNSIGVYIAPFAREVIAINNQVSNAKVGFLLSPNLRCEIRDNQNSATAYPYYGGFVDLGGNT